ncbi:glycosyltransferase family 61 protein [Mucilaginibacter conchicola]|uniref:Glycosyltransferase family 61 protein n=1 Tax=Mucilaginibacter conchicola TaxID=2303333 RepID=A0A372NZQ6_9SPHI|nr:glycosyltransferase family 61 protein [Mucilaginibacter conchicola]RFZ95600.1 glycosyltransferase family 61 protein [Mucilaginibacter conchicola]
MTKSTLCYNSEEIKRATPSNYLDGELDFCRDEFSYQTNQITITNYKNCYVTFRGHLYNNNYSLVKRSLIAKQFDNSGFVNYVRKIVLGKKRLLTAGKTYLLCFDEWSGNHYHWINDFLTRLCVIADQLHNYTLLLPDVAYIKNIGVLLLPYFNLQPNQIEWIKPNEVLKVANLNFVSHPVITGKTHDRLAYALKKRFVPPPDCSVDKKRRIYISRSKSSQRFVLNEDEVISLLKRFDFEIIHYEDLNIHEQIKLTCQANMLVSIHGAGLANAIFMSDDSAVLEFRRDNKYINQCYWHLSSALHLKYYYLFGEPDSDIAIEGHGCNLTIPLDKLQLTIEKMISDLSDK